MSASSSALLSAVDPNNSTTECELVDRLKGHGLLRTVFLSHVMDSAVGRTPCADFGRTRCVAKLPSVDDVPPTLRLMCSVLLVLFLLVDKACVPVFFVCFVVT